MSGSAMSSLFALIAVFAYSISNFLLKKISQKDSPQRMILARNIVTSILLFIVLILSGQHSFPAQENIVFYVVLVNLGVYLGFIAIVKAFAIGKFGLLSAISEAKFIPSMIIYSTVFGELIRQEQWLATLVVIVGLIILFVRTGEIKSLARERKAMIFALVNALFFGTGFALLYYATIRIGANITGFISEFSMLPFAIVHLLLQKKDPWKGIRINIRLNFPVAISAAIGTFAFYQSQSLGDPNSLAIIMTLAPVINVFLGTVLLKEKYTDREWLGVSLIISGLLLLLS